MWRHTEQAVLVGALETAVLMTHRCAALEWDNERLRWGRTYEVVVNFEGQFADLHPASAKAAIGYDPRFVQLPAEQMKVSLGHTTDEKEALRRVTLEIEEPPVSGEPVYVIEIQCSQTLHRFRGSKRRYIKRLEEENVVRGSVADGGEPPYCDQPEAEVHQNRETASGPSRPDTHQAGEGGWRDIDEG